MALGALAGALALGAPAALAARGHVFERSFGEKGPAAGQLESPRGVAVNEATGDVYVADASNNRVTYFTAAGAFAGEFNGSAAPTGQLSAPEGIAVDNACTQHKPSPLTNSTTPTCEEYDPSAGDVYVVDTGHHVVDKFTAEGTYLGQLTEAGGQSLEKPLGVAVDRFGHLWVYRQAGLDGELDEFTDEATNKFVEPRITSPAVGLPERGVAVAPGGDFYVVHQIAHTVAKLSSSGADFADHFGEIEGATGIATDPASEDLAIDRGTGVTVLNAAGSTVESLGATQLEDNGGAGVAISAAGESIYVADSAAGAIDVFGPQPVHAPAIVSQSVSEVTATSALLLGEVNPDGATTEYRFELGRCGGGAASCASAGFETSLPASAESIAAGFDAQSVSVRPEGLLAGASYHFRLVVTNSDGSATSEPEVFTTQSVVGGEALLDGREWELVSPPEKHGALIEAIGEGQVTQAAADGGAITYLATNPTEADVAGNSNLAQLVSRRTATKWVTRDISLPHDSATGFSQAVGQEYRGFSEDLSAAVVQPFGAFAPSSSPNALAPGEASEQTPFWRSVLGSGGEPCEASCYRPIVTSASGHADVPEGTVFGGCRTSASVFCGPLFEGASRDLSHVVVSSKVALSSLPIEERGLYEWSAGALAPVGLLPGGTKMAHTPELGYAGRIMKNAVSPDGTMVVWTDKGGHLYATDVSSGETVQIDTPQGGSGAGGVAPIFEAASSDGRHVFFTDQQQLTSDSGAAGGSADLYECLVTVTAGKPACELRDLTPLSEGEPAQVQYDILGAGEDGAYVYLVANGVLAKNAVGHEQAEPGSCQGVNSKVGAACNLYELHRTGTGWETHFIARLAAEDYPDWNGRGDEAHLARLTARVSPSGRWLAFMSERGLTGYDTRDAVTGHPDEEVYVYQADTGRVVCASCNPTGARPVGREYGELHYGLDGGQGLVWHNDRGIAASVPAWTSFEPGAAAMYQSRYLSDSGRLFFNSEDALVPQDVNGAGDVYEFEPPGAGSCTSASLAYVEPASGCVGVISSGTSNESSGFLDASETGGDVFFFTAAKLSSEDRDTALDVYDAHVCSTAAPCFPAPVTTPAPCASVEGCRGPAPAPPAGVFGVPASASISGAGNVAPEQAAAKRKGSPTAAQRLAAALRACRRHHVRARRAACMRRVRRELSAKRSRVAARHNGGTGGAR